MTNPRPISVHQPRRVRLLFIGSMALASAAFIGTGVVSAQDAVAPAESPAVETVTDETATDETASAGIDGTWMVDTEVGDFADYSSSWVGFRVAEVLQGLGDVDAVGRTPTVSGMLVANGTTIESALIEVDLTTITSDQPRRDPAIQRALDTVEFPTATLATREPVDLGAVPADGEPFSASVPGTLTIHGVSQDVAFELTGQRAGDVVVVVGTLPVDFTSFGITMPTAPIVISVEDAGDLEWQLFLRREGGTEAVSEPASEG